MEKRALLAIGLSVGILLLWQFLFAPGSGPPKPPGTGEGGPAGGADVRGGGAGTGPATPAPVEPLATPVVPQGANQGRAPAAEVVTPLYQIAFGADGAVVSWALRYRGVKPLALGDGLGPLSVVLTRPGQPGEVVALAPEGRGLELSAVQPEGALRFRGSSQAGVRIEKVLRFRADGYLVDLELSAAGLGDAAPGTLGVYWTSPVARPGPTKDAPWTTFGESAGHEQMLGRILATGEGGHIRAFDAPPPALKEVPGGGRELKDPHLVPPEVGPPGSGWIALDNDYFMAALLGTEDSQRLRGRERDRALIGLVFPHVRMDPGQPWKAGARLYVGPKEWHRLTAARAGLEGAQSRNYGHFLWYSGWGEPPVPFPWFPMSWVCVPLLWLMNFIGTRFPGQNYGVAIILLTVLVKVLFYPLTHKSMTSMKQMQALQPQLNALKAKYRSDPQRFQREQMELFRKYRVNPMGGCLPMIVQIPIFYALYLALQYSVELQGAPFLLWITDLSKKDPYYVLPILMGVSMLIQQKMTPTVGDPRQARIMLIMPVVFTFMFLEFPTGLVLYWLVNNVLSVAQQYLIDRATRGKAIAPEGRPAKEARKV